MRNFVDFVIEVGSKALILTHGNSLYSLLTDQEIGEITRVVAEHNAGRAMIVAADNIWWTGKEIEFARYAREVGADMLMVLPPDWGGSCTPETSRKLPETSRNFPKLQKLPETSRNFQKLPETSRNLETSRNFQKLPET